MTAFVVIVLLVVGVASWLLAPAWFPPRAKAPPNVVMIEADMAGFSTTVIKARVGQPLTVRLKSLDSQFHSDGGGQHQFAIDELKVNIVAPPQGTSEATFTPMQAGTYEFYCDICCGGRANPSMVGQLIVEA
jgi:heme/copper-type cytochrome/quinol oxidase subunit 2